MLAVSAALKAQMRTDQECLPRGCRLSECECHVRNWIEHSRYCVIHLEQAQSSLINGLTEVLQR